MTLAAGAVAGTLGRVVPAQAAAPAFLTKIDFKDPKWNRDAFARLDMDLDPTKQKIGWFRGGVYGVRDNEPVRTLFTVDGFSVVRSQQLPDGSWRRMLREIGFYRDVQTGQIMETWHNPYTQEDVRVVPIANDPFNYTIGEFLPEPPSYGGLNKDKPPKRPLLLDWAYGPDGTVILTTDIHLFYPSALQPDKWPRESAGSYSRVSEMFKYVVKREDLENPAKTHVPCVGSWARVTPWLPWMLMGQAPGCINYFCSFGAVESLDQLPADLVAAARAKDPKWLSAPDSDYGPSLSSIENYAREQKPAPVPPGWTPPMPPPPRVLPGR
ncbi:DUF1838 family protein [Azospirillum sp. B4]|uniref:DUF1838 family protein n=1 Tax=Azospirillum sp. B4 TaxID=95605 RepID=UPI0003479F45|nr:DUF1838 family protein [Azospirillum sp. B4]